MFDISAVPAQKDACEAGFTFEPVYPDSTRGIGATITIRGPQSDAVRAHSQAKMDEARDRIQAGKRRAPRHTVETMDEEAIGFAVVYTIGWEGMTNGGQPLPFSPEAARELYRKHTWLAGQVVEEANNLGNFIKPSLQISTSTPQPSSDST